MASLLPRDLPDPFEVDYQSGLLMADAPLKFEEMEIRQILFQVIL
jgi:hypothetical protein